MLSNITIGQYFPGNSILHRLDPRVKVLLLFFFLIEIFLFSNAVAYGIFSAVAFGDGSSGFFFCNS